MTTNRVKGITVEIGGDVTGLDKALKKVNSSIINTQRQLRDVTRLLELDPTNTELLAQKQRLLSDAIDGVNEKLRALRDAEKQAQEQFKQGKISQEQYDALQREIIYTEQQLKKFSDQADDAEKSADALSESIEDAADASKEASDGFTIAKGALADLAARGIEKAIDAAKDFATGMIESAAEVKAQESQFEQAFGGMAESAEKSIGEIAGSTGILETRLNSAATSIFAFAKASGATETEALDLMETSLQAAADSAAYYDKSLEETTETLQSFLKGNFANDAALGVSATETTRNAKAMELFGRKYNDLTEIEKQKTLLQMVTDAQKLSGAMGQAAREADGWENVQGNLNEAWRQFQAEAGAPVLEKVIPIIKDATKTVTFLGENLPTVTALIGGVTAAVVAQTAATKIKTAADIASASGTTIMATAQKGLNAALKANPIGIVITAITLLITSIKLLWDNSEKFRDFFIGVWDAIKIGVKGAINTMISAINGLIRGVVAGMNAVVSLINAIKINIPDWVPKLGGKSIGFNLKKLTAPQIPLLAEGGILPKGKIGFLEGNGAEAVVPLDQNHKWIAAVAKDMAEAYGAMQNGGKAQTQINIYPQTLDNSTVDYLFARFNAQLGAMA